MRSYSFLFLILLITTSFTSTSKSKVITGRVLEDGQAPIPVVLIMLSKSVFASTDVDGYFKLEVPDTTTELFATAVGMEPIVIILQPDCSHLEIIMLRAGSYDFMSTRKVDRKRKKYYNTLPTLNKEASKKKLFRSDKPCFLRPFLRTKEVLEKIKKMQSLT